MALKSVIKKQKKASLAKKLAAQFGQQPQKAPQQMNSMMIDTRLFRFDPDKSSSKNRMDKTAFSKERSVERKSKHSINSGKSQELQKTPLAVARPQIAKVEVVRAGLGARRATMGPPSQKTIGSPKSASQFLKINFPLRSYANEVSSPKSKIKIQNNSAFPAADHQEKYPLVQIEKRVKESLSDLVPQPNKFNLPSSYIYVPRRFKPLMNIMGSTTLRTEAAVKLKHEIAKDQPFSFRKNKPPLVLQAAKPKQDDCKSGASSSICESEDHEENMKYEKSQFVLQLEDISTSRRDIQEPEESESVRAIQQEVERMIEAAR